MSGPYLADVGTLLRRCPVPTSPMSGLSFDDVRTLPRRCRDRTSTEDGADLGNLGPPERVTLGSSTPYRVAISGRARSKSLIGNVRHCAKITYMNLYLNVCRKLVKRTKGASQRVNDRGVWVQRKLVTCIDVALIQRKSAKLTKTEVKVPWSKSVLQAAKSRGKDKQSRGRGSFQLLITL